MGDPYQKLLERRMIKVQLRTSFGARRQGEPLPSIA